MKYSMIEVLEFIKENDIKFVKLAFCDLFGVMKNISIMPEELPRAFESGISFDASSIPGFTDVHQSDLFLYPDASTIIILPWRPSQGRVVRLYCDITYPDKTPFESDMRGFLKKAVKKAEEMGYICKIGSECEFYLFETDERGNPTDTPFDKGGYFDIGPVDKGENVRREICITLEQMGIVPESSHHEQGPGQNEIDFKYSDALTAADNFMTFKSVVKTVSAINGLYASFMPKPLYDNSGNGLHINLSLSKEGVNIFNKEKCDSKESEYFIAGILDKIAEITAFANPITNSYARFGSFEAPKYIAWSHQNRSPLIRIPADKGDFSRMELRSPDPSCNPYITFALLLYAGLEGIEKKMKLPKPTDFNIFKADEKAMKDYKALPQTLDEAINIMSKGEFIKKVISDEIIEKYIKIKKAEVKNYKQSENKLNFEKEMYYKLV